MYRGSNPTALKSQELICQAFFKQMSTTPLSKVSVSSICAEAGVSRQTFYTLFRTKESVIDWYLDQIFLGFVQSIDPSAKQDLSQLCRQAVFFLLEDPGKIRCLTKNGLESALIPRMKKYIDLIHRLADTRLSPDDEYAGAFLAGGMVALVSQAIENGSALGQEEKDRLALLVERIISGEFFVI